MNGLHDEMKFLVDFFAAPADMLGVLRHLQTGSCDSACIHSLARSEHHSIVLEEMNRTRLASHVGNLAAAPAAIGLEFTGIIFRKFILESARQCYIAFDRPCLLAGDEFRLVRELGRHILNLVAV